MLCTKRLQSILPSWILVQAVRVALFKRFIEWSFQVAHGMSHVLEQSDSSLNKFSNKISSTIIIEAKSLPTDG